MKLMIHAFRDGYNTDQVPKTMTVAELTEFLAIYKDDTPIFLSFDDGYAYGGITRRRFEEDYEEYE